MARYMRRPRKELGMPKIFDCGLCRTIRHHSSGKNGQATSVPRILWYKRYRVSKTPTTPQTYKILIVFIPYIMAQISTTASPPPELSKTVFARTVLANLFLLISQHRNIMKDY